MTRAEIARAIRLRRGTVRYLWSILPDEKPDSVGEWIVLNHIRDANQQIEGFRMKGRATAKTALDATPNQ